MGVFNQKADYELLDHVAQGDLKDAAMCMSAAEDIQVLQRLLAAKNDKLEQYIKVFFGGRMQNTQAIKL
jgi:hypothetical protein